MTKTHKNQRVVSSSQKTLKKPLQIKGHILEKKEGWISLHIYGEPFERGYAHGRLLYKEIRKNKKRFHYNVVHILKITMSQYLDQCNREILPKIQKKFPEFYEEIRGISAGCKSRGVSFSTAELVGWNSIESLHFSHNAEPDSLQDKCSAFIATGDATEKGDIVMAHNTHSPFIVAQSFCVVMYVTPQEGMPFVMQTAAGFIASTTDWFLCSSGIIGCETTISSMNYRPSFGIPYFCRIRQAMQYGKTLDDYVRIMKKDNAGDYACSWQFGDIHTGEIMLLELGLREHSVQRTKNGVFYGMNSAMDITLRSKETDDITHYDMETSSGARNARWKQLLYETYYGKINIDNARLMISDHYDVTRNKIHKGSLTLCKHLETEPHSLKGPYFPAGCTDGKVVDSQLAKEMRFYGRFGSSCGRVFRAKEHIRQHPEYNYMKSILEDFPRTEWTLLSKKEYM